MQSKWSIVKLEEVLTLDREPVEISPSETYRQITVRLHHKGIVLRGEKIGQKIKSKQYLAKEGQFIISRIDARNGAMGLVPHKLHGAIVTNDFLLYDIDENKLFPKYFDYLTSTKSFVNECIRVSKGTTNRVRLKPEKFLEIEISPPPLEEQRRIIAHIESMIERAEEARRLRVETVEEAEKLFVSSLLRVFETNKTKYPTRSLENVAKKIADINHRMPKAVEDGAKFISPKDFTPNGINFNDCKRINPHDFDRLRRKIQPKRGDILYSRIGTVGQARLVDTDENFIASYSIVTIRPNPEKCLSKYLLYALQSPTILTHAKGQVRAIAMPDLGIKSIRKFQIPLPPVPVQRRTVTYLDSLQAKLDELKELQGKTEREIEELIPSILDKAFKGESYDGIVV